MSKGIIQVNGSQHAGTIDILTNMKLIVSRPYRGGYLVARWGMKNQELKNFEKELDGDK